MATEKRLIDADALIEGMEKRCNFLLEEYDGYDHYADGYAEAINYVENAPTVGAVEVPCKMGDIVWGIKTYNGGRLFAKKGVVHQMYFGEDMRLCICVKEVCRGEWGKNVFATEDEAIAAIERRTNV